MNNITVTRRVRVSRRSRVFWGCCWACLKPPASHATCMWEWAQAWCVIRLGGELCLTSALGRGLWGTLCFCSGIALTRNIKMYRPQGFGLQTHIHKQDLKCYKPKLWNCYKIPHMPRQCNWEEMRCVEEVQENISLLKGHMEMLSCWISSEVLPKFNRN